MKKIKEYVARHKWWLLIGCLVFLVIIPLLINWLFKTPAPFELLDAEWCASDALSFYGTILASVATIVGVYLSIDYAQKNYREDERNRVRPYFALTYLNSRSKYNWLNDIGDKSDENIEEHKSVKEYEEYRPERIYVIIQEDSIDYRYELTEDQKKFLARHGMKWQKIGKGARALTRSEYISLPFEVENVGNGVALCFQVGFYAVDQDKMVVNFCTVKPNTNLYVHIFANNIEGKLKKNYCLELVYWDILGNQYSQKYPVRFEKDEKTHSVLQHIDMTGIQEMQVNKDLCK